MSTRARTGLHGELENLRASQLALSERLCRMLTAMAASEEAAASVYQRLDALDDHPNGHRDAAAVAAESAHTYRRLLSVVSERMANP